MGAVKISWNEAYVKKLTRAEFQAKFKNVYPRVDLDAEFERITGKQKRKKAKKKE